MPGGEHRDGGSAEEEVMMYARLRALAPRWLRRQALFFETRIEEEVTGFARGLQEGVRLLDAGAGEGQYREYFGRHQYVGFDLGIGDATWNYAGLDCVGDLLRLPFRDGCFGAVVSVVTLEHVTDPARAVEEMSRVAAEGARLLLVVPLEWEVHQSPHDYYRFTRHVVRRLLEGNGWEIEKLEPAGGFFRLLSRRLMNGLQFFPAWMMPLLAVAVVPVAVAVGWLDPLDKKRDYTLGYFTIARRARKERTV